MGRPLGEYTVLYFPPVEWSGLYQRPHHLAFRMAETFRRVLYVQPSGLRTLSVQDIPRVWNHLRATFRGKKETSRKIPDNMELVMAPQVPIFGWKRVQSLNTSLLYSTLKKRLGPISPDEILIWGSTPAPFLIDLFEKLDHSLFLFDWIDDYRLFTHLDAAVHETQDYFVQNADVVFVTSKILKKRAQALGGENIHLFPNGVDIKHWKSAPPECSGDELSEIASPIIGYFGTLSHWIDRELVIDLAQRHREWNFVFIGPMACSSYLSSIFDQPNCHWLGQREYSQLPFLASCFDVCWMPFRMDELTKSINPVKVYEYLATGKPVVSSPLPDVMTLGEVVDFARNNDEYEQMLEKNIKAKKKEVYRKMRMTVAEQFGWDTLWKDAMDILDRAIPE